MCYRIKNAQVMTEFVFWGELCLEEDFHESGPRILNKCDEHYETASCVSAYFAVTVKHY